MTGYLEVNLKEMLEQIGESEVKNILSNFSCPLNSDVESFLKDKAILFANQGIASTYLIMASYKQEYVLAGYYTLSNKFITVYKENLKSKTLQKRIAKFSQYDKNLKRYTLSAPLIGQLGKNYNNSYNKLITGDELLYLALQKVKQMQMIVGGKIVYLECEEKETLLEFYTNNGFVNFGTRKLDRDETTKMKGEYLVQLLKYMH